MEAKHIGSHERVIGEMKVEFEDLPGRVIELIVRSQFSFVHDSMETGDHRNVILRGLGTFGLKRGVLNNPDRLRLVVNRREAGSFRSNNMFYKNRIVHYDSKKRRRGG